MPYFIYAISADRGTLKRLESHAAFQDAKPRARQLRAELPPQSGTAIKIIFAGTADEAEARLSENRPAPVLKEWEK